MSDSNWSKATNTELADRLDARASERLYAPELAEAAKRLRATPDVCREFVSDERSPLHCRRCGMQKYGDHQ